MTFQSRISKTRKRLSDERWSITAVLVSLFGLFAILTFGLRAVTLSGTYGVIPLEIPVVQSTLNDPGYFHYREEPHDTLGRNTPTVVLTTDAFFFGDLEAFTVNFTDVRDKYLIRHVNGEPQLKMLLNAMTAWVVERSKNENIPTGKVLVFAPAGDIPMPIVIEIIAGLRSSPYFDRVILSSGLM